MVIGNTRYHDAPLKNPVNDAKAIAAELQQTGFKVALLLDAGRAQMTTAIQTFGGDLAKSKGVGLFYYAGHGAQLAWRNYLIPIDAVIEKIDDLREKTVDLNSLLQGLIKASNAMNVIILDACRDNPFGTRLPTEQKGLSQFDAPPGSLLAYATSPGNTAGDGEGTNGLYTENLLKELKAPEAKIEDVFKRVRLSVRRRSQGQQIPWESTSLEDDFYFLPPSQIRKLSEAELERQFNEELAVWEGIKDAETPDPYENYLQKYPSGKFSELAQFELDRVLAQRERAVALAKAKVAIAEPNPPTEKPAAKAIMTPRANPPPNMTPPSQNPFSKGTGKANTGYRVRDNYEYVVTDTLTKLELRKSVNTVSAAFRSRVIYNNGQFIKDRLGNLIKEGNGIEYTDPQLYAAEYSVGKKWTTRYRGVAINGQRWEIEIDVKVSTRELITVPAGTFDAFKVECHGFNSSGLSIHFTYWIAPEQVRWPVKMLSENRNRYNNLVTGEQFELTSFLQRSDAPQPQRQWKGTYNAGPVLVANSKSPEPYTRQITMVTRGQLATVIFENKNLREYMFGPINDNGEITLSGRGNFLNEPSRSWRLQFSGRIDGEIFQANGAILLNDGKTKARDCTMSLNLFIQPVASAN